jgi:hypothetical protein
MANEPRTAFLGLRSNVHFFASRQGFMNLESRVKALALLYDRLVFEDGVYECTVGEQGTSATVQPYHDPVQLRPQRTRKGESFVVRAAITGTEDFHPVIDTRVVKSYRSQFRSTLEQLVPFHPDWALVVDFDHVHRDIGRAADKLAGDWSWRDQRLLEGILPNTEHYL